MYHREDRRVGILKRGIKIFSNFYHSIFYLLSFLSVYPTWIRDKTIMDSQALGIMYKNGFSLLVLMLRIQEVDEINVNENFL